MFEDEDDLLDIELHAFSNAFKEAFAASKFITAKTKMAPKKTILVAKQELQAALLGARLCNYIGKAFTRSIARRYFWTDSSFVRNWICSSIALHKPFVNHRIGEIQTLTDLSEWRFIPGKLNPSDHAC